METTAREESARFSLHVLIVFCGENGLSTDTLDLLAVDRNLFSLIPTIPGSSAPYHEAVELRASPIASSQAFSGCTVQETRYTPVCLFFDKKTLYIFQIS